MKPSVQWTENDLLEFISTKREESLQLDFKDADSLRPTDKNKTEISKDVSAFANSAGGTILYGMAESKEKPSCAERLSPIHPKETSKEWLEQIINSRIHPRIQGILINPIELKSTYPEKYAYVIFVPQGATAHQAFDKRYYKRFNFESVPMEDYEIRQILNRTSRPSYTLKLKAVQVTGMGGGCSFRLQCIVQNASAIVGHDVSPVLFVPRHLVSQPDDYTEEFENVTYTRLVGSWAVSSRDSRPAISSAQPLVPYAFNFEKDIRFLTEIHALKPLILYAKIFDKFGNALTTKCAIRVPDLEVTVIQEAKTSDLQAPTAGLAYDGA
jgi:hypothetical protein